MNNIVLGDWLDGGRAKMDLQRLLAARLLLQAGSGFGKSWALRRLLEQTAGSVQQFIIDPEGEFATLREKHDYVIAAVNGGDALAHPRTAGLLLRRLMETGVSAILDISELKKPERRRFVRLFVEELMQLPREMWAPLLVVIDEAHEFAPEKDESESLSAIVDLATRGRKRGFALVAATQRIGKLSKDVAAELHNKLIGFTSLDIDVKRAAFELGLTPKDANEQLRALRPGDFYAFGPATSQIVQRLHIGAVATTHPEPGTKKFRPPPSPTDAIKAVLPKLADLPKEADEEARTVADLKKEIARLTRELKAKPAAAADNQRAVAAEVRRHDADAQKRAAASERRIAALQAMLDSAMKFIITISAQDFFGKDGAKPDQEKLEAAVRAAMTEVGRQIDAKLDGQRRQFEHWRKEGQRILKGIEKLLAEGEVPVDVTVSQRTSIAIHTTPEHRAPARERATRPPTETGNGERLPTGETAVLTACIQFPDGLRREQLTVLTAYKRSSRDAYIQRLRERGYVETNGERVTATEAGRDALPDAEPLPTGLGLQEHWLQRLPEGERKILQVLIDRYPDAVERSELDDLTGYKRSSRDAYLQRMSAKQLFTEPSRGLVRASEDLF